MEENNSYFPNIYRGKKKASRFGLRRIIYIIIIYLHRWRCSLWPWLKYSYFPPSTIIITIVLPPPHSCECVCLCIESPFHTSHDSWFFLYYCFLLHHPLRSGEKKLGQKYILYRHKNTIGTGWHGTYMYIKPTKQDYYS